MARQDRLDTPGRAKEWLPRLRLGDDAFGDFAEAAARFMGTGKFIVWMSVFIFAWILWNVLLPDAPDGFPFIFLTLLLSLQASYAAPLILLAQNRQENRDRVALEEDRRRAEQTKADTEFLARELAALRLAVGEVATRDYLRHELEDLRDMLVELVPPKGKKKSKHAPAVAETENTEADEIVSDSNS